MAKVEEVLRAFDLMGRAAAVARVAEDEDALEALNEVHPKLLAKAVDTLEQFVAEYE